LAVLAVSVLLVALAGLAVQVEASDYMGPAAMVGSAV
jgi:hypothetical protein